MNSTSTELTGGALDSGSGDNLRWEITSTDVAQGTFSLLIRRGDDNTNSKTILESYSNVSLDPKANNYIARVIGDQVQEIRTDGSTYYLETSGSYANV